LPANAVLCVACGLDLRTGQRLQAPQKTTTRKRRGPKAGKGKFSADELPALLDDAADVRAKAREVLDTPLPILERITADLDTLALRAQSRLLRNRCSNPDCKGKLPRSQKHQERGYLSDDETPPNRSVYFTVLGKQLKLILCWQCAEKYQVEQAARQDKLRTLLEAVYEMLRQAQKHYPDDERIRKNLRAIETLAAEGELKLGRKCFIATAAYGSPGAEQVRVLRRFRDAVLLRSSGGRWLVQVYDTVSPPLAALLQKAPCCRAAVRWLLQPVVGLCKRRLEKAAMQKVERRRGPQKVHPAG
jgi:hypothetical protein